jgi:LPS sulfotransferase NodH
MQKNFVILSQARSGSTWLVNTINNINHVSCYGEMFFGRSDLYKDGATQLPRFTLWRRDHPGIRPLITYRYLNEIIYSGYQTTGFKLMYVQLLRHPEVGLYILGKGIAVIHLIRQNILNSVLSSLVAHNRGKFHFKTKDVIPEEEPIWLDPKSVLGKIRAIDRKTYWTRKFLKLLGPQQKLEVYYEDLDANAQNFKAVWDFMGADFEEYPPTSQFIKARKKSPAETILNYREVQATLSSAGYGRFLDQ